MPRRRRRFSRLELFYSLVIAGLMAGGSIYLDRKGVPVTGRVAAKQERIVIGREPSGEWDRYYEVTAAFEVSGSGGSQATVRVLRERYDALRAGDPIEVRYLPQFPFLARTGDRSTASVVRELAWALAGIPILEWLVGGLLALWIAARMGTIPVLAAGAGWIAAAYPLLFSPPSRDGPRPAGATAQVRGVTLVDKSPAQVHRTRYRTGGFDRRLEVPYQVVELLVPILRGQDTVLAVDAVDSGSVTGLAYGARLPVRLDPAAPREAQLAGGTRQFVKANRYHFLVPVIGCGILGTLAGLAYVWRRGKREMTTKEETMDRQGIKIMPGTYVTTPAVILALAAGLMAGGNAAAEEPRRSDAGGGFGIASCPAPAAIETTIGFPVKPVHLLNDRCMYELTGEYRGAFVTLTSQPATRANDLYADIRKQVKGAKGVNAKPDAVSLGEGGWGYGTVGKQEAAAVSQGMLYHVELDYDLFESLALRKDAAVRVLDLAIRSAPAGKVAAAFDACMLATNAEVSQIAEEKPEFAKYWSAPATAMGGAHCDYDGASIRVYQGKAPAAALDATLKSFKADKQPRVPAAGLGDKAFFMIPMPDNKYNRLGLLAVYAGPRVLQLTLDAQGDEPIEATRPRLERLARLVLPRLR